MSSQVTFFWNQTPFTCLACAAYKQTITICRPHLAGRMQMPSASTQDQADLLLELLETLWLLSREAGTAVLPLSSPKIWTDTSFA